MTDEKSAEHLTGAHGSELDRAAEEYRESWEKVTHGPQLEGLTFEEAKAALQDDQTITGSRESAVRGRDLPFIVPIEHSGWYNPGFYEAVESDEYLYFAAPTGVNSADLAVQLHEKYAGKTVTVFYDRIEDDDRREVLHSAFEAIGLEAEQVPLGLNSQEASLTQFAGPARIKDREGVPPAREQRFRDAVRVGMSPEHTSRDRDTRILTKPVTDEDFEQIWDFYVPSFEEVNSGHPLMQSFDRESLREMLDSPDSLASVAIADGKIVSIAFLSPISECPWLDSKYYQKAFPDQFFTGNIVHMPTVVTDKPYRGQEKTTQIFRELVACVAESGNDVILLGECNDFTVEVIPVLADAFFADKESRMTLEWNVAGVYKYGAIRITVPARP